jgi:transposase
VAHLVDTVQELRQAQRVEVFFADESHWSNEPSVQRGWCRKGKKRKVAVSAKRHRTTLFGALHLSTQKMYWKRASRGPSKAFMAFLHQLHQCFAEALILLILDNAQIHRSRLVKRFVQQHDWIELEHVEPYSPAYNLIERFWKWLKAQVYGASSFDTIEEVVRKIRQMIWHSNERWLISTIDFKFEPYQNIL